MNATLLDDLKRRVRRLLPLSARRIQGFHHVHYRLQWAAATIPLDLQFLVVISGSTGCCFFDEKSGISTKSLRSLVGLDLLELDEWPLPVQVAAIDAAYGATATQAGSKTTIHGLPQEKALKRAKIIAREVVQQLLTTNGRKKPSRSHTLVLLAKLWRP